MKYIDAEKLKVLLSDLEENHKYYNGDFHDGVVFTVDEAKEIIDSLRQEQPELSGYDKGLLEVKRMVDKLYDEASIGLNEYDSGLYNGIAETCMKLRGFIKAKLDSDEQPQVDLEKEIKRMIYDVVYDLNGPAIMGTSEYLSVEDIVAIARHFYELDRNARKNE